MSEPLLVAREGAVSIVTLNRPASKNALSPALVDALGPALEREAGDEAVRAIVLTGAGGAFCSGADLKAGIIDDPDLMNHLDARMDSFHRITRAIIGAPKPVLAAVDGPAVGFGCDLALACDLRIITEGAYFQEKFVKIGLMPDGGGTFFLPRLVGLGKALELMYSGEAVRGEEAARIGLASRVVPADALMTEALAWATTLSKGPPMAHRLMKAAVWASFAATPDDALRRERDGQLQCLRSADAMEGVVAWMQRREPSFSGR